MGGILFQKAHVWLREEGKEGGVKRERKERMQ
jgi:hypothetical protein